MRTVQLSPRPPLLIYSQTANADVLIVVPPAALVLYVGVAANQAKCVNSHERRRQLSEALLLQYVPHVGVAANQANGANLAMSFAPHRTRRRPSTLQNSCMQTALPSRQRRYWFACRLLLTWGRLRQLSKASDRCSTNVQYARPFADSPSQTLLIVSSAMSILVRLLPRAPMLYVGVAAYQTNPVNLTKRHVVRRRSNPTLFLDAVRAVASAPLAASILVAERSFASDHA